MLSRVSDNKKLDSFLLFGEQRVGRQEFELVMRCWVVGGGKGTQEHR